MKRKPKAYRRSKRKEQVLLQLRIWHENGHAKQATSYKLAKALDITPSPHFRDILNEMVADGDLLVVEAQPSGRYPTKFYLLANPVLITKKYSRRHISVKSRGQNVGQLELPTW
jgi:hypothetical protein